MAPDGEQIASAPARTLAPAKVAFRLTSAAVFKTPKELGPTIRVPHLERSRVAAPLAPRTPRSFLLRSSRENEQRSCPRRGRLGGEFEHLIARGGDDHADAEATGV